MPKASTARFDGTTGERIARAYLTGRYHDKHLEVFFPLSTYIGANLKDAMRNLRHSSPLIGKQIKAFANTQ